MVPVSFKIAALGLIAVVLGPDGQTRRCARLFLVGNHQLLHLGAPVVSFRCGSFQNLIVEHHVLGVVFL